MRLLKRIRRKAQKLIYREQYSLIAHNKRSGREAHILPPSEDCIWADPFPIERDGLLYIFIEQQFSRKKGEIGYIIMRPDMTHSEFHPALKKPYHLSYPHIFELAGSLYMIPETNENNSIDCYACKAFPDKWEFCATLIPNIRAVDADIIFHEGLFYIAANAALKPGESLNQRAYVYYSKEFPGAQWKAHPQNPVADSLAFSRNAGKIYSKEGKLYRPAQDCAKFYGALIRVMEITELSPNAYKEREAFRIEPPARYNKPGYKAIGTHTYNETENYILTDIKTQKRKFL